jgi:hypothetical protein
MRWSRRAPRSLGARSIDERPEESERAGSPSRVAATHGRADPIPVFAPPEVAAESERPRAA